MKRLSLLLLSFAFLFPGVAFAQKYPSKPITIIVGFAPGGTVDLTARLAAQILTEKLGQQVIVENKPGATGMIADQLVTAAAPDGYTLLNSGSSHATNPATYAEAKYHPVTDFTPIINLASTPYVLVVQSDLPVKSVAEFVTWVKGQKQPIDFASSGNATRQHMSAVLMMESIGAEMVHIPYKGSGPAINDMLGGRFPVMFENAAVIGAHIKSGKMRPLAVTTATRSTALPDVPTMMESGFPTFEMSGYFGLYGPPKLPADIVKLLNNTLATALATPEIKEKMERLGAEPVGGTPEAFAEFVRKDTEVSGKLIRDKGIKAD